jgi:hypothetical protein
LIQARFFIVCSSLPHHFCKWRGAEDLTVKMVWVREVGDGALTVTAISITDECRLWRPLTSQDPKEVAPQGLRPSQRTYRDCVLRASGQLPAQASHG